MLLGSIVLAAACQSDGADRPAATRVDSAGIELVHNAGTDRPLEITTSADFGLGGQGAGPESFYQLYPRYVAVGPDGSIAVLNRPASEARPARRSTSSTGRASTSGAPTLTSPPSPSAFSPTDGF